MKKLLAVFVVMWAVGSMGYFIHQDSITQENQHRILVHKYKVPVVDVIYLGNLPCYQKNKGDNLEYGMYYLIKNTANVCIIDGKIVREVLFHPPIDYWQLREDAIQSEYRRMFREKMSG